MVEFNTLAVDGVNEYGELATMYIRWVGGIWHWWWDAARADPNKSIPEGIPDTYKNLLTDYGTPYMVCVQYTPESFKISKL